MSKIKYSLASSTWDEKELASIQRVIESGNYSMGNEVIKFESFQHYVARVYSAFTASNVQVQETEEQLENEPIT